MKYLRIITASLVILAVSSVWGVAYNWITPKAHASSTADQEIISSDITITYDGKLLNNQQAYWKNGYLMISLEAFVLEMGYTFKKEDIEGYLIYNVDVDDEHNGFSIDQASIYKYGYSEMKIYNFPEEADTINGKMYIPILSIINYFNADASYDPTTRQLTIQSWSSLDQTDFEKLLQAYYGNGSTYPSSSIIDTKMKKKVFYQQTPFLNALPWQVKANVYKIEYMRRDKARLYVEGTIESPVLVKKISGDLMLLNRGKGWKVFQIMTSEPIGYIPESAIPLKEQLLQNKPQTVANIQQAFAPFIDAYNAKSTTKLSALLSSEYIQYLKTYAKRPGSTETSQLYINNIIRDVNNEYGENLTLRKSSVWYIGAKQAMLLVQIDSVKFVDYQNNKPIYKQTDSYWIVSMDREANGKWKIGRMKQFQPDLE
ncbi:hypothetical protein ACE3MZ_09530 [Paenibacillus sp. WLX1005]|uniref:hypothetical protein n=1 Tax=Paenibacillus sp. WLX1005 TaxID=3243766 RepID=UPI003984592E